MQLRIMFPYDLDDRYGDEYKTEYIHINMIKKFTPLPRKHNKVNRGNLHRGFCKFLSYEFNSIFHTMMNINIRNVPKFIRTFFLA